MRTYLRFFVGLGFTAGLLYTGSAGAALSKEEFACQDTVAKQGQAFFAKAFKALAKCKDSVNNGKLPVATDCTVESSTAQTISDAETTFRDKIGGKCSSAEVTSLSFGDACFGVTTVAGLQDCLVITHTEAAEALIDMVYDPGNGRICDGGSNDGGACTTELNCPGDGTCVLDATQSKCLKSLAGTVVKYAKKRMSLVHKCKKSVAKDDLAPGANCVATAQEKLDELMVKSVEKIRKVCPDAVAAALEFGGSCGSREASDAVAACALCTDVRESDALSLVQHGSSPRGTTAEAKQITDLGDCVGGPLSRCRLHDYLLANDRIRVVIQDLQRNLFGIGQFGGQIIDADLVRTVGQDRDNFEEWALSINLENTAHYTGLSIVSDGSNSGPAIIRVTGVDDLLDYLNPSSVVAGLGFQFPSNANDRDLPLEVLTDYILDPGQNYVRVETTLQNTSGSPIALFFGEFINGSGQVELFQPGYGFGEPLVTTKCPSTPVDLCNFVAWSGEDEADGVSYGYVHDVPGSSTFSTSGVIVPQLGVEVALALLGLATEPFTLAAMGSPGDSMTFTRFFVVGDGTVSSITDARNEIQCLVTGRLEGTVTAGGSPAEGADIVILGDLADGPGLTFMERNVVTHTRTDADGKYSVTLPPGDYTVVGNIDGSPFQVGSPALLPLENAVTVAVLATTTQDIVFPATGSLQVTVVDETPASIAAKVSVVGFDSSPDPLNAGDLLGLIMTTTAVFGDHSKDGLPFGLTKVLFLGPSGDSGTQPIEPGDYRVVVSHGPEYSISEHDITVSAAPAPPNVVNATVERVLDTSGFISADFHVHSIDSVDSEVTREERVVSMLAEGVDLFAATDHEFRADFQPTIAAVGAESLITSLVSAEITTFDYGHFNAWPMTVDPNQVNGGSVDFGKAAPDGQDFPSFGNYNMTPAEIIAAAHADPNQDTVQVNHMYSHFGLGEGSGLAIDTALTPPASHVAAAARRLNPAVPNFFTDTFDALEVWIGDSRGQILDNFLGQNAGDWFNLINQGIVRTGVADSDTHKRVITQAGMPRTLVASPTDDPGALGAIAETLSANVNAGRAIGTNAPMVRVTASTDPNTSTGETASLELGDPTEISTTDGAVDITVDVQSAEWAPFDRIEFYVNSTTTRTTLLNQETGAGKISVNRYSIEPDYEHTDGVEFTKSLVAVPGTSSKRWEATTTLNLSGLTDDIWVVVIVKGTDGNSPPLFPVIPNSLNQAANTSLADLTEVNRNLGEDGITAVAFTNPLFIDVDGGGWDPPGVRVEP